APGPGHPRAPCRGPRARGGPPVRPDRALPASGAPAADGPATIGGLPRRVRQASLVPQLRGTADTGTAPAPAGPRDDERDADEVRARMASMQRGWQRGRRQNADGTGAAPGTERTSGPGRTAPGTTSEGDGR
ncbi:histidine kinase, partial [Streptomyces sp. t39]